MKRKTILAFLWVFCSLSVACSESEIFSAITLLSSSGDPNCSALLHDFSRIVKENKADVNALDQKGETPLFKVVSELDSSSMLPCIEILCKHDANPNGWVCQQTAGDSFFYLTPLMKFCQRMSEGEVPDGESGLRCLLRNGANPNLGELKASCVDSKDEGFALLQRALSTCSILLDQEKNSYYRLEHDGSLTSCTDEQVTRKSALDGKQKPCYPFIQIHSGTVRVPDNELNNPLFLLLKDDNWDVGYSRSLSDHHEMIYPYVRDLLLFGARPPRSHLSDFFDINDAAFISKVINYLPSYKKKLMESVPSSTGLCKDAIHKIFSLIYPETQQLENEMHEIQEKIFRDLDKK